MLTKAEGRASLLHILKKLRQLQNSAAYQEAESQCGNDMLKRVQLIYPLVIRAEMNAVTDYGFAASYAGLSEYMHEIYVLSGEDKEVERLMSEMFHFLAKCACSWLLLFKEYSNLPTNVEDEIWIIDLDHVIQYMLQLDHTASSFCC
ncbi:hypothetical protein TSPI_06132 [Trichinella spiralis]|uniref:Protein C10 n=1 Tax=Trichinella spiralis TaxID=6334 RepID=A0ABR3KUY5_TRISP